MKVQFNATAVLSLVGIGVAWFMLNKAKTAVSDAVEGVANGISNSVDYVFMEAEKAANYVNPLSEAGGFQTMAQDVQQAAAEVAPTSPKSTQYDNGFYNWLKSLGL
jgi:hypothetical protein